MGDNPAENPIENVLGLLPLWTSERTSPTFVVFKTEPTPSSSRFYTAFRDQQQAFSIISHPPRFLNREHISGHSYFLQQETFQP